MKDMDIYLKLKSVLLEDLDKAIAHGSLTCNTCLLAQAVMRETKEKVIMCGYGFARTNIDNKRISFNANQTKLQFEFDAAFENSIVNQQKMNALRAKLPLYA